MAAQAGLCLAWSETPEDTFSRGAAHYPIFCCDATVFKQRFNDCLCYSLDGQYGMPNVALFDIFIFLSDLTSLLLYILGLVFNI